MSFDKQAFTIQNHLRMKSFSTKFIFQAALLVGTLDILAAFANTYITSGKGPEVVLKFIASGVLGKAAFSGGTGTVLLGLLLHYGIAAAFTCVFFWSYPKLVKLVANKIVLGVLYGAFVWLVMNLIVLPLSSTPKGAFGLKQSAISMAILIVCIGLPLVFMAGKEVAKNKQAAV